MHCKDGQSKNRTIGEGGRAAPASGYTWTRGKRLASLSLAVPTGGADEGLPYACFEERLLPWRLVRMSQVNGHDIKLSLLRDATSVIRLYRGLAL